MKKIIKRLFTAVLMSALLCSTLIMGVSAENVTPGTQAASSFADAAGADGVLKVLTIGNSHSQNSMNYLYDILEHEGYDDAVLAFMYKGGCNLADHAAAMKSDEVFYEYHENSSGSWSGKLGALDKVSLSYAFQVGHEWDFIVLQEGPSRYGGAEEFDTTSLNEMIDYVSEKCPDAKLLWNMTWAWGEGSVLFDDPVKNAYGYEDTQDLYERICAAVQANISTDTFECVIPSGTAVRNVTARYGHGEVYNDNASENGEMLHLNQIGMLTAAYTWYAALTGDTVDPNNLMDVFYSDGRRVIVDKNVIAAAANNAIAHPFEAEHDHSNSWSSWNPLSGTSVTISGSGNYYLTADVTKQIVVPAGATVTLCLNGNDILPTSSAAISLSESATLNLCNCGSDAKVGPSGSNTGRSITTSKNGVTVNMYERVTLTRDNGDANGGGVYLGSSSGTGATFNMYGGTITKCKTGTSGSCISMLGVNTFNLYGGEVSYGVATNNGGNINLQGTLNMYGGEISYGVAGKAGGGVYMSSKTATLNMYGGQLHHNTAGTVAADGSATYANTNLGGGVYLGANTAFTMEGGLLYNNWAYNGGGVYLVKPTDSRGTKFTMSSGKISYNDAQASGGGVYVEESATFTMSGDAIITLNESHATSGAAGSGVYNAGTFAMNGGTISSNSGKAQGGGVYNKKTFTMTAGTITENSLSTSSGVGGGVYTGQYAGGGATFTMTGGIISKNQAKNAHGGGVANYDDMTMSGSATITENTAGTYGGGILNPGTLTMNGGTISNNTAGSSSSGGGGVHTAKTFTMNGGTISGNTATKAYGGGVYVKSGTFKMSNGTFSGNTAATDGDGVYVLASYTFNMTNGNMGGEIAAQDGTSVVTITGGKFSDDTDRDVLGSYLVAGYTGDKIMSVKKNTGADAAAYAYVVGEGFYNAGEDMDFGSSLALGVRLNADVNAPADVSGYTGTVSSPYTTTGLTGNSTDSWLLQANGIAAKDMDKKVTFKVMDGTTVLFEEAISIYDAAKKWAEDETMETMMADMLNYGNAAKLAFETNPTLMEVSGMTGSSDVPTWSAVGQVPEDQKDIVAVSLNLKERIELNVYVKDEDATVSGVSGATTAAPAKTTVTNGNGETFAKFTFRDIPVNQAKTAVEFTVNLSDGKNFTMSYSIADYAILASKDGQEQQALIQALMKYVDSVSSK